MNHITDAPGMTIPSRGRPFAKDYTDSHRIGMRLRALMASGDLPHPNALSVGQIMVSYFPLARREAVEEALGGLDQG